MDKRRYNELKALVLSRLEQLEPDQALLSKQIAQDLQIHHSTITTTLTRLRRQHLVDREKLSGGHGRKPFSYQISLRGIERLGYYRDLGVIE